MADPDDLPPLSEGTTDLVRRMIEEEHGYLSWLGTRVETIERGRVALTVPYDEKLTNTTTPPTIHGGVAATLIDTAGGLALRSALEDPAAGGVATVNLNVNYLRRADGDLTATADVVRAGGSIGVSEVDVVSRPASADADGRGGGDGGADGHGRADGEAETVATGQGAYRLFR